MVAIVSGNSLGLNLGSLASLGANGRIGSAAQGRNGEGAFVNVSSGNLVLQDTDGLLMGVGLNVASARTYNSQGQANFTNGDGWSNSQYKSVIDLGNGVLQRTDGDGSVNTYAWDDATQTYLGTVGAGAAVNSIVDNGGGSYTWTNGTTGVKEYYSGAAGLIQASVDTHGNATSFAYNTANQLTSVTDASGETVHYTYDGANLIGLSTTLQSGTTLNEVSYTYDAQDRLTSVSVNLDPTGVLPAGSEGLTSYVTQYAYDGDSNRIASVTQSDGTSLSFTYVQDGGGYRVASMTDGLGNTTTFAYDAPSNTTTVTDPMGVSSVYAYDAQGQLTQVRTGVTAANGAGLSSVSYTYDGRGDVTSITDGAGGTVQIAYDAHGNQISQTDAAGNTQTWTYNSANQVETSTLYSQPATVVGTTSTAANGADTTRYVYAASDATQLRFVVDAEGHVTEYVYNANGTRASAIRYPASGFDTSTLGATDIPTESQMLSWAGAQDLTRTERSDMQYDFRGQLIATTSYSAVDATGAGTGAATTTSYVYDQHGQLLQSIQPNASSVTHYTYDGLGRRVTSSGPSLDGITPNVSLTSYDDANGKATLTLANGLSTISTYDAAGRLISVTQASAAGNLGTTTYAYDPDGRLLMTQDPTGVRQWTMYDAQGRKTADISATGLLSEYFYDVNNQVVKTISYATPIDVSLLVDANGAPITQWGGATQLDSIRPWGSDKDSVQWNFYDRAHRLVWTVDGLGNATRIDYDGESRVTATTQLANRVDTTQLDSIGEFQIPSPPFAGPVLLMADAYGVLGDATIEVQAIVGNEENPPTGTFSFYENGVLIGTQTTHGGLSTELSVPWLSVGTHTFEIVYAGDEFNVSASTTAQVTIESRIPSLVLKGVPPEWSDLSADAPLVMSVEVTLDEPYPAGILPSGTVTFYNNDVEIGQASVINGVATFDATGLLDLGFASITAQYSGDDNYGSSGFIENWPDGLHRIVEPSSIADASPAGTWSEVHVNVDTALGFGVPFSLSSSVLALGTNAPVTGGTVSFYANYDDGSAPVLLGTANVANGQATISAQIAPPEKPVTISAVYSGDADNTTSDATSKISVTGGPSSITVSGSPANTSYGVNVTLTAQVDGDNPDGIVTFYSGSTILGYAAVVNGEAVLETNWLATGPASITAAYTGDARSVGSITAQAFTVNVAKTPEGFATPDPEHDRTVTRLYDQDSRLQATIDGEGYLTQYKYDSAGQLVETVQYARAITGFTDAASISTALAQARSTHDLSALLPPDDGNDIRSFQYFNARGQLSGSVDGDGYLTETVYDVNGNVAQTIRYATPASGVTSSSSLAQIRPQPTGDDQTVLQVWNAANELVSRTAVDGTITTFSYDEVGQLVSSTLAVGTSDQRTLTQRHDVQGRVTAELSANGAALLTGNQTQAEIDTIWAEYGTTYSYDAAGRRTSATDAVGDRTVFFYDDAGRLRYTVDALGDITENTYDTLGHLASSSRFASSLPNSDLNGLVGGLLSASANADVAGALASAALAIDDNSTTSYVYDAAGERIQSIDALGRSTDFVYDAFGEVTQSSQSLNWEQVPIRTSAYDRRGLVTSRVSDVGVINATSASQYDAFGRLISSTDANGNVTTAAYDPLGRVITTTDALGNARSSSYDAFGRVLTQTDALGAVTTYGYDTQNRTTTLITPEGISVETVRTAEGQIHSITDGNGNTTNYTYDADGNLLSTITALTTTTSTYDAADRLISSTDANGNVVELHYDAANRIVSRTLDPNGLNLSTTYEFDAKDQQVQMTDPMGVVTTFSYDLKGEVLTSTVDPTGLALTTRYTYDDVGNVLTVISPSGAVTTYTYDDLGRRIRANILDIWSAQDSMQMTTRYEYDAVGNMVLRVGPEGYSTHYAYDSDNRVVYVISQIGGIQHTEYDANGRVASVVNYGFPTYNYGLPDRMSADDIAALILESPFYYSDQAKYNVYDNDGRLTNTVDATGAVTQYAYDGAGNVVSRTRFANRIDLSQWTRGTPPGVTWSSWGEQGQDQTIQTVYDQLNRAIFTFDGTGALVGQTYDGNGNVVDRIAYANTTYTSDISPSGLAAAAAAIADPSRDLHIRSTYDAANRLTWSVNGVGSVTHNEYDADGRLVKQTQFASQIQSDAAADSVLPSAADRVTAFAYDAAGRRTFVVDALGDVTQSVYDVGGNEIERIVYANRIAPLSATTAAPSAQNIASAVMPSSNDRKSYAAFDQVNRQIYAVDAEGGVVRNVYDNEGNVIVNTVFANRIGSLDSLVSAGELTVDAITAMLVPDQANDRSTLALYYGSGLKSYSVDPAGYMTRYSYDGNGNVTDTSEYLTKVTGIDDVDIFSNFIGFQILELPIPDQSAGKVRYTFFSYDGAGNLSRMQDAEFWVESYEYNGLGEKISFTNKLGTSWHYAYDAAGHMTTEYAPDPSNSEYQGYYGGIYADAQTVMTYDALGNITSRTEGANSPYARVTRYEYDALGRQVRTTYPAVYVYDGATDAANGYYGGAYGYRDENWVTPSSEVYYDTFGDAIVSADVGGNVSVKTYDALGRISYDMDALGYVTGYVRNTFGDVTALTHYANASGLITGVTAAAQSADAAVVANNVPKTADVSASLVTSAQDRTIQTRYDALGRPTMVIQPQAWVDNGDGQPGKFASAFIQNTYNAFGQVVQVLNGGIDQLGQEIQQSASPDITRYIYDRNGNQTAKIDALGYLTAQTFDDEGNVLSVTQYATALTPNSASPTGFSPAVTSSDDRTVVYGYDLNNQKISQTQVNVLYSTQSDGVAVPGDLTTTFGYDALGNNTRTTDALGNTTYTYYDANGRIRAVAGPATYDGGDQTLIALTEFTRDVFGNVTQKTEYALGVYWADESGYQIKYAPDGGYGGGYGGSYGGGYGGGYGGSYPANRVTSTTYDAYGHAIQVQDANGNNHYMSYDVEGRIAKSWQTISNYSAYFPNGGPEVLYTVYQYDALGRQTGIITPASNIVFNNEGLVKRDQDVVGYVINGMSWNAFGEMVASGTWSSDSAPQYQQSYEYDNAGRLWRTNSGDGNVKVALFNLQGQQTSQIASAGSANLNSFSSAQAVDAQGNSGLRRTDMQRDLLGHIRTETLPQRQDSTDASPYRPIVYMDYDRWGNVVSQSDPRNASWLTTYTYNANNQVIQKYQSGDPGTDGSSATTRIFYDALGRQVAVLDANNHLNGQVWNAAGQLIQEQHADTGVVSHTYDALGEQIRQVDADGNVTDYRYDGLGNNTVTKYENVGVYHSNAAFAVTGEVTDIQIYKYYDAAGRLLQQTDNAGDVFTMYSYDLRGNVVSTTDKNNHSTLAAYDAQGKQTFSQDANGNVASWSYDTFGQLTGHTDIGGASYAFTYDAARQLISQTNSRGQDLEYQYDAAGQLTDIQSTISGSGSSAVIQNTHYAYNAAGQHVLEQTTQGGVVSQNQTLGYDFFGRLALVNAADGVTTLTDYDRVGNKVSVHATYNTPSVFGPIGHVEDLYFAYDSMNRQIMADGAVDNNAGNLANINANQGHILTYDKNGNRLSDTAWGNRVVMRYDTIDESGTALGLPTLKDSAVDRGVQTQFYTYDTMNRLSTVSTQQWIQMQTGWTESGGEAGGATTTSEVYGDVTQFGPNITLDSRKYDGAGRLIVSGPQLTLTPQYAQALSGGDGNAEGATSTINTYDDAGRMTSSFSVSTFDPSRNTITYYQAFAPTLAPTLFDAPVGSGYDAAGNLLSYRTVTAKDGDFIITSTVVQQSTQLGEGYKETGRISLAMNLSSGNITNGQTIETYDNNGFLTGVADFEPTNPSALYNNRTFVNDAQGHVLTVTETALGVQTHQLVLNGQVSATYGFTQDPVNPTFPNGVPNYQVTGNFDLGYQPVTNSYPAASTGTYSVRAGDTLKDIALASYGDASMWYVIANANGMQGDSDLRVGQVLNIPTKVAGVHNSSNTYAPYDPSKIVGSTSPALPTPAGRAPDSGCGGLGQIVMVVVAVIATIYTAGLAAEGLEGAAAATGSAGTAAAGTTATGAVATAATAAAAGTSTFTIGLSTLAGGYGITAAVVGGAVGGLVGSIASQTVGIAIGAQQDFNWNAVAVGAIGGAISGGLGYVGGGTGLLGGPTVGATAARAAISSAATQGISVALGLQQHFSWSQVAASAIGAGVSAGLNDAMGYKPGAGFNFGKSLISGIAGQTVAAVAIGGKVNLTQIASGAFGSITSDYLAGTYGQQTGAATGQGEGELKKAVGNALGDGLGGANGQSSGFGGVPGPVSADERARDLRMFDGTSETGGAQGFGYGHGSYGLKFSGAAANGWSNAVDQGIASAAVKILEPAASTGGISDNIEISRGREDGTVLSDAGYGLGPLDDNSRLAFKAPGLPEALKTVPQLSPAATPVESAAGSVALKILGRASVGLTALFHTDEPFTQNWQAGGSSFSYNSDDLTLRVKSLDGESPAVAIPRIVNPTQYTDAKYLEFVSYKANGGQLDVHDYVSINPTDVGPVEPGSSTKPDWLRQIERGNAFNAERADSYPYNEVYIEKPSGEGGYFRVDSYNPILGEIVSRKSTQFSDITERTGIDYVNELATKYPAGATIANVPSNQGENGLAGQVLRGRQILEVPVQTNPIPQSVINAANSARILIRDVNMTVYNRKTP